jgi:hypothetical protein
MKTKKQKQKQKISYGNRTITKKKPHFGNYDIYSNPKPKDTVRIKYSTLEDVKFTITKLESLYKRKLRPHSRISKIANVLQQRLRVIRDKNPRDKQSIEKHKLAIRYFSFLKSRTKLKNQSDRMELKFKI